MSDDVLNILDRLSHQKIPRKVFMMAVLKAVSTHGPCLRDKAYNTAAAALLSGKRRRGYQDDYYFQLLMNAGMIERIGRSAMLRTTLYGEYVAELGRWPCYQYDRDFTTSSTEEIDDGT